MVRTFDAEWDAITALVRSIVEEWGIDPGSVRQGMLGDDAIDGESVWISLLPGALTPGLAQQPVAESATCTIWLTAVSSDGRSAARKRGVRFMRGIIARLTSLSISGSEVRVSSWSKEPLLVEVEAPSYVTVSTEFIVPITYTES